MVPHKERLDCEERLCELEEGCEFREVEKPGEAEELELLESGEGGALCVIAIHLIKQRPLVSQAIIMEMELQINRKRVEAVKKTRAP